MGQLHVGKPHDGNERVKVQIEKAFRSRPTVFIV